MPVSSAQYPFKDKDGATVQGQTLPIDGSGNVPVADAAVLAAIATGVATPLPAPAITTQTATIANGASLSGAVDLSAGRLAKINMPAGWTAADLTFQTSATSGGTFRDLYDATGAVVTVKVDASRSVILNLADWLGSKFVKVRSGTPGTAVNQGASRDLELVLVA